MFDHGDVLGGVPETSEVSPIATQSRQDSRIGARDVTTGATTEREQGTSEEISVLLPVLECRDDALLKRSCEFLAIGELAQRVDQLAKYLGRSMARQFQRTKSQMVP